MRLTVGTALGLGGNHSVGLGVGATTVRFFATVPPSPFLAVMMIWLLSVNTSTQAVVSQPAIAAAGVEREMNRMRMNKGFMCRHDKCVPGLMPLLAGLSVDSCDTLSSWAHAMEMVGCNAPAAVSTGASTAQLESF